MAHRLKKKQFVLASLRAARLFGDGYPMAVEEREKLRATLDSERDYGQRASGTRPYTCLSTGPTTREPWVLPQIEKKDKA